MARAVVPRTAAAVDHADTELIGHRGWEGSGVLCGGGRGAAAGYSSWQLTIICGAALSAKGANELFEPSPVHDIMSIITNRKKVYHAETCFL